MNCEEHRSARLAGEESPEMATHRAGCPTCANDTQVLDEMRTVLAGDAVWTEPGEGLEQRTVDAVVAADRSGPDLRSVPETTRTRGTAPWLMAAAVVVAIGIAVGTLIGGDPDWSVDVPGTEIAPEASAVVEGWNTDSGTRMRLTAAGLPPAPKGHVYEMWLSSEEIHVSAGTFRTVDSVDVRVGVRRADYPRVWITLEPLDGDQSPTWEQTVLDTE